MGNRHTAFDKYDGLDEKASLGDRCTFCGILQSNMRKDKEEEETKQIGEDQLLLHEDDLCVIFLDIKNKATAHYQCIPKRHIKNYSRL